MAVRVHPKYWELMERLGLATGVDLQDLYAVLGSCPTLSPASLSMQQTHFELTVDKHYPIELKADGRILEIAGPSNRNKTTTLVYAATLLGIDWGKVSTFIDSQNVLHTAELVQDEIEQGQKTFLHLSNDHYELTIKTENSQVMAWLKERATGNDLFELDGTPITLRHESDWALFRGIVRRACDVQMVGKGRNFVVQVGLEEGHALADYADELYRGIGQARQEIQLQAQESPTVNEDELARLVEREQASISALEGELTFAREARMFNNTKAQDLQALADLVGEIHASDGTERYLSLSAALETVQIQERQITGLAGEVAERSRNIAEFDQSLQEGRHTVEIVHSACSQLMRDAHHVSQSCPSIADLLSGIESAARQQDLSQISILAAPVIRLSSDSDSVYPTILKREHWSALSEGSPLMPVQLSGTLCSTVGDLKRFLEAQAGRVAEALRLRPLLNTFDNAVGAAGVQTTESLNELRANCTALATGQDTRRAVLTEKQAQLDSARQAVDAATRPFGGPHGLAQEVSTAKLSLPHGIAGKMEQAETKAAQIGMSTLWGRRDSGQELHEEIAKAQQIVKRSADEVARKTALIRDAHKRISEYQEMLSNPSSLSRERNRRMATLTLWQPTMRDIRNYFSARRRAFESDKAAERAEQLRVASAAQMALGSNFALVIETLNQLIKERSPFCYLNRDKPTQLRVKSYDFLRGQVTLEDEDQAVDESTSGGGESAMTVRGLASRITGTPLGNVLLVDEFGDAPSFKDMVFDDLKQLNELGMAVFVNVVNDADVRVHERG